ncbi:MAG TPA: SRPBCC domain-containing protein [Rubrobacter sp.]|nr:SRPBCC domain-containing protein [Rubrobacter sp.]
MEKKSSFNRLLTTGLIGAGVGLLMGSRTVKVYDWHTEWSIPAPLPDVYEAMTSRSAVKQWWPSMELMDDDEEDELRVGSSVSFSVHQAPEVARLAPPFRIHCVYTDVEPERRLREIVTGDLTGVLETLFRDEGQESTRVDFNWYVRVTNPALNLLGYVAERVYRHSHDTVMNEGEGGLRKYCAR